MLLRKLELSKSSYYQETRFNRIDKYQDLREKISAVFYDNKSCYDDRRIHTVLKKNGTTVSEKVMHQLMREGGLFPRIKQKNIYSSYKGENISRDPKPCSAEFSRRMPESKVADE